MCVAVYHGDISCVPTGSCSVLCCIVFVAVCCSMSQWDLPFFYEVSTKNWPTISGSFVQQSPAKKGLFVKKDLANFEADYESSTPHTVTNHRVSAYSIALCTHTHTHTHEHTRTHVTASEPAQKDFAVTKRDSSLSAHVTKVMNAAGDLRQHLGPYTQSMCTWGLFSTKRSTIRADPLKLRRGEDPKNKHWKRHFRSLW